MKTKSKTLLRILAVFAICAMDILCGVGYIYCVKQHGYLHSVKTASENLPGIFAQNLITAAFPLALFFIAAIVLKKQFSEVMYLRIKSRLQIVLVSVLSAALLGLAGFFLVAKADEITVLYNLFYYFFFVAFTEEFVVHGVCVYLLHDCRSVIRYLVPNLAFGMMHLFAYADYGALTAAYLIKFLTTNLLGLVVGGCFYQALKEKTGTLWVPIILHALMDYTVVFSYV